MNELTGVRWSKPGAFKDISDYDLVSQYRDFRYFNRSTNRELKEGQSTGNFGHAANMYEALRQVEMNNKVLRAF